jgi:hypothetical protein
MTSASWLFHAPAIAADPLPGIIFDGVEIWSGTLLRLSGDGQSDISEVEAAASPREMILPGISGGTRERNINGMRGASAHGVLPMAAR